MKKILLILLLCACQSWATQNIIAGGKWSAASILATDTVTVTGTTSADTIDAGAYTFVAYKRPASNTAAQVESGVTAITITGTGIVWDDSGTTGAKTYADSIEFTSASGRVRVSSGSGSITSSVTSFRFNGLDTLQDNKGLVPKACFIGRALVTTGASATTFTGSVTPLVMDNNTRLTVGNGNIAFRRTTAGAFAIFGTNDTVNGSGNITWGIQGSVAITMPAYTYTGSGANSWDDVGSSIIASVQFLGTINIGNSTFQCGADGASHNILYDFNNQNITCGSFRVGSGNATGTVRANYGSGTFTCTDFTGSSINVGSSFDSLKTAVFRCSGNWTNGSAHTIVEGTSTIKFIGTSGTSAITSASKNFYDIVDSTMSTGTLSTSDPLRCHNFTKATTSSGALTFAGDSVFSSGTISIDGASNPAITFGPYVELSSDGDFHIGSTVGTATLTGCDMVFKGTGNIDFDKNLSASGYLNDITLAASGKTSTVTGTFGIFCDGIATMGGGTLTLNGQLRMLITQTSTPFVYNGILNGNSMLIWNKIGTVSCTTTINALTHAGTGAQINSATTSQGNWTILQGGNLSFAGGLNLISGSSSVSNLIWKTNNYSWSYTNGTIGAFNAVDTMTVESGSSVIAFTGSFETTSNNTGKTTIDMATSNWRITGNYSLGSNTIITRGTSTIKLLATSGTQALTIANTATQQLYDIIDSSMSTGTVSTSSNLSCHSYTKATTSSGGLTFAGDSIICDGDLIIDGASSPAVTLGTAVTMNGASSQLHIGSGVGTVTATSTNLYMNTATAGVIDDDKGLTSAKTLYINGVVTNSGAANTDYSSAIGPLLTLTNNSVFHMARRITFGPAGSMSLWSLPETYTWDGNGGSVTSIIAGLTGVAAITVPGFTCLGTGNFTFQASDTVAYTQTGNIFIGNSPTPGSSTTLTIGSASAGATVQWTNTTYSVNSGSLNVGSTSSRNTTVSFGSGTYNFSGSVDFSVRNSATSASIDSLQYSVWNVASWINGTNHTLVRGNSVVRMIGTGTVTTAGKPFWDFRIVGSSSNKVTLADSLQCAYYYDSTGKFTQNSKTMYVDSNYVNVSPDSASMSGDIYLRNYYRNTPSVYRTAGAFYFDTTKTCLFNSNGYGVGPVYAKNITFQDTGRIQKYTTRGDSCLVYFAPTKGMRIDTLGDISGSVGKLNYFRSSTPTTQARLWISGNANQTYGYWKDICVQGGDISCPWTSGCRSGGGGKCP